MDKIVSNDSVNWNNCTDYRNSWINAVAQNNANAYTQLSNGHRKQFEKRVWKVTPRSNPLHGMNESVQSNPNGIIYAKIFRCIANGFFSSTRSISFEKGPAPLEKVLRNGNLLEKGIYWWKARTRWNLEWCEIECIRERASIGEANEQWNAIEDEAHWRADIEELT